MAPKRLKIFILEDDRERVKYFWDTFADHDMTVVDSCTQADRFKPPYDVVFLDHDLGGRQMDEHEDCGLEFVKLIKSQFTDEYIVCHSYNPEGRQRMLKELMGIFENVCDAPFRGRNFNSIVTHFKELATRD